MSEPTLPKDDPVRDELRRIYGDPLPEIPDELRAYISRLEELSGRSRLPSVVDRIIRLALRGRLAPVDRQD